MLTDVISRTVPPARQPRRCRGAGPGWAACLDVKAATNIGTERKDDSDVRLEGLGEGGHADTR